jgi:hypothetical protein
MSIAVSARTKSREAGNNSGAARQKNLSLSATANSSAS